MGGGWFPRWPGVINFVVFPLSPVQTPFRVRFGQSLFQSRNSSSSLGTWGADQSYSDVAPDITRTDLTVPTVFMRRDLQGSKPARASSDRSRSTSASAWSALIRSRSRATAAAVAFDR